MTTISPAPTVADPSADLQIALRAKNAIGAAMGFMAGKQPDRAWSEVTKANALIDSMCRTPPAPAAPAEPGNWSVYNTAVEHASGLSYADAMEWLTDDRLERGWSAVCVVDKENRPAPPSSGLDEKADARDAERQALAERVRDGIADFAADNWPLRKFPLDEIEERIKRIEISAKLLDAARALSSEDQQ